MLYQPLRSGHHETRLLVLLPSIDTHSVVQITLEIAKLHNPPEYEAISWCWGDGHHIWPIMLDGKWVDISRSLHDALMRFRYADRPRKLWADAVCINQDDVTEREEQVALMGDIYRLGRRTLVWLGPMRNSLGTVIAEQLQRFSDGASFERLALEILGFCFPDQSYTSDELGNLYLEYVRSEEDGSESAKEAGSRILSNLLFFIETSWWDRLWVLQEVALAADTVFYWGETELTQQRLMLAFQSLRDDMRHSLTDVFGYVEGEDIWAFQCRLERAIDPLMHTTRLYKEIRDSANDLSMRQWSLKFVEALGAAKGRSATDERDMVYGLLGLFPSEFVGLIKISYSLSKEEVFNNTAYRILETSESYMIFSCCTAVIPNDEKTSRGHWAPDWADLDVTGQDLRLRAGQEKLFGVGGAQPWKLERPNCAIICLSGFRIDSIVDGYCNIFYGVRDGHDLYHWIKNCLKCLARFYTIPTASLTSSEDLEELESNSYVAGGSLWGALVRTFVEDSAPVGTDGDYKRLREDDYVRLADWLRRRMPGTEDDEIQYRDLWDLGFHGLESPSMGDHIFSALSGKNFWLSKLGYMAQSACGRGRAENGLELWALAGGALPVLLVPIEGRPGHYRPHGEAYVHGIMDGEVSRGERPVLPADGDPTQVKLDIQNGRTEWPIPQFQDIYLV